MRLVVMMTIGGSSALIVPSSGTVTWKSDRISSRNASKASSVRSSSSIRKTGAAPALPGQRIEHRAADQVLFGEDIALHVGAIDLAGRLLHADLDHLRGIVPLIDGGGDIEALIALQADQPAAKRLGEHLGDLGLADAGLTFEEQRPLHTQREKQHGRQRPVRHIVRPGQEIERIVDRPRRGARFQFGHSVSVGAAAPLSRTW